MTNITFTDAFGLQHKLQPLSANDYDILLKERIENEQIKKEVIKWLNITGVLTKK